MGGVRQDRDAPQRLLQIEGQIRFGWLEDGAMAFDDVEQAVVVAGDARQIDGNDGLRPFIDGGFNLVVVHLQTVLLAVDEHQFRTDMADDGGRRRVGIGGHDDFVARADAHEPKGHFRAGGLAVQADRAVDAAEGGDALFELLDARPRGDPARVQSLNDFLYF